VKKALVIAFGAALAAALAFAVLYGTKGPGGNQAQACAGTEKVLASMKPLAKGEVAAVQVPKASQIIPDLAFAGPDGQATSLSALKGKTLLVNLWATWCVPCREEMPALDKLQAQYGGERFEVVAVNIDTTRLDRRHTFLREGGVSHLNFYADPSADLYKILQKAHGVTGLPTTFLIDSKSCLLGAMAGGADWASPDAFALIEAALRQ